MHAEALHRLAARPHLFDIVGRPGSRLAGFVLQLRRPELVEQRDDQQQEAGKHRQKPEHPVEGEQGEQEYRRPWRIEEGERTGPRCEPLHRFEVAQPGCRPRALGRRNGAVEHRPQYARVEGDLHPGADPGHDPAARMIEDAHHQEQEGDDPDEGE